MPTTTLDIQKEFKQEYVAKRKPVLVETGPCRYFSVTGCGVPGAELFTAAIGALYGAAFTIKMTRKFAKKPDFTVSKLECLWGTEQNPELDAAKRDTWAWQLMIRTAEFVTQQDLEDAVALLLKRGKGPDVKRVELVTLNEGLCVQALHVGPYDKEGDTVTEMKSFAESKGFTLQGRHHEIYVSDPRRVPPDRLKTILRHPVR